MCSEHHGGDETPPAGLYVVATPIGNLGDLSPRARSLLAAANVVAAEDTRTARRLLDGHRTAGEFVSLTEHNVVARIPQLVAAAGERAVALVSEAGTPAIADPGTRLVAAAHDAGIKVLAVPGPSALAAALSVSGFDAAPSTFLGFLPKRSSERRQALLRAAQAAGTLVFYESPRRLAASLNDVAAALDDPEVVVCRELTKLHEEVVRGKATAMASRFAETRGECTVVVRCPVMEGDGHGPALEGVLGAMKRSGARRTAAAAEVARLFRRKRADVYDLWDEI
jgi:16S rRNA (cytidine1402-2'-O)-methyltransferase